MLPGVVAEARQPGLGRVVGKGVERRAVEPGAEAAADFLLVAQVLVITGASRSERSAAREAVRAQIAFYASTPAYRPVLEAEGEGELQGELRALTRQGGWSEMSALVTDAMLERYAVCGEPAEVGRELRRRYRDVAARVAVATPMLFGPKAAAALVAGFREGA